MKGEYIVQVRESVLILGDFPLTPALSPSNAGGERERQLTATAFVIVDLSFVICHLKAARLVAVQ